jgi:hypothetical protein
VSGGDLRPDRHILLELDALLARIEMLLAEGDRARSDSDERYRWVLHRLWIAAGNEALAKTSMTAMKTCSGSGTSWRFPRKGCCAAPRIASAGGTRASCPLVGLLRGSRGAEYWCQGVGRGCACFSR